MITNELQKEAAAPRDMKYDMEGRGRGGRHGKTGHAGKPVRPLARIRVNLLRYDKLFVHVAAAVFLAAIAGYRTMSLEPRA
ncbi:MAG: hypothetical protein ACREDM_07650 [Methylocella sp.]